MKVVCDYCGERALLVTGKDIYPHREDLADLNFWRCRPCDAYVGCHKPNIGYGDGTRPLGRLANAELRAEKSKTHAQLDPIWKLRLMGRREVYLWLAKELDIPVALAHIGMFDVPTCQRVQLLAQEKRFTLLRAKSPG